MTSGEKEKKIKKRENPIQNAQPDLKKRKKERKEALKKVRKLTTEYTQMQSAPGDLFPEHTPSAKSGHGRQGVSEMPSNSRDILDMAGRGARGVTPCR